MEQAKAFPNPIKHYVGTKTVRAVPLNRLDYNNVRGWTLPADENGEDDGYMVEYVDGGKANVPGYAGYISWSPKDVFERSYVEVVPTTFVDRVLAEKNELDEKIRKLDSFISSAPWEGLSIEQQCLLEEQLSHMDQYSKTLGSRIATIGQATGVTPKPPATNLKVVSKPAVGPETLNIYCIKPVKKNLGEVSRLIVVSATECLALQLSKTHYSASTSLTLTRLGVAASEYREATILALIY